MRATRLPATTRLGTAAAILCAAIVVVALGILQYRWNREASDATGVRLADALQLSMINWHLDLFRNLSELCLTLRPPAGSDAGPSRAAIASQLAEWRTIARYPELVAGVYVIDRGRIDPVTPDSSAERLPSIERAADVLRAGRQIDAVIPERPLTESFYNIGSALREWRFDPAVPALARTVSPNATWLLVRLDDEVLRRRILPDLARRYFQGINGLDYDVAVIAHGPTRRVIYTSTPGFGSDDVPDADARMDIFAISGAPLRIFHRTTENNGPTAAAGISWFPLLQSSAVERDWQLVARHRRGGPLGEFVLTMSRRGLAMSYGALALLVLSMSMLVVTGMRAHRLGRLQMDFVTAVSHELRTPLTIIGSAADNLRDDVVESPEQMRDYGAIIGREVDTLSGLVERILLFVSTRDGRHQYSIEALDARDVIDAVVTTTGALARAADVRVERDVDADLPPVMADRAGLTHCLENLVTNALKYGGDGGRVTIRATTDSSDAARGVCISVTDSGPGIDAADRPHIFEPFYRGQAARARQIHGTGLGLALARQMAEAMGGSLDATNVARGASFTIRLRPATAA